jgi:hypothetical protein
METGAWTSGVITGTENALVTASISFAIPLSVGPEVKEDPVLDENHAIFLTSQEVQSKGPATTHCPGSAFDPLAEEGYLCVYQGGTQVPAEGEFTETESISPPTTLQATHGSGRSGAIVTVHYAGPLGRAQMMGSWAVTAE